MDVSDPKNIREVNPLSRLAGLTTTPDRSASPTSTIAGKDFWLLCAYDNGGDRLLPVRGPLSRKFNVIFSLQLEESELQSLSLVTDVANNVFAIGLHRTGGGGGRGHPLCRRPHDEEIVNRQHVICERPAPTTSSVAALTSDGVAASRSSATTLALFCTGGVMAPGAISMDSSRHHPQYEPRAGERSHAPRVERQGYPRGRDRRPK